MPDNKYCNLIPTNLISAEFEKINTGFDAVEADVALLAPTSRVNAHIAGTAEQHAAEKITYSGSVAGATDVKQGLDLLKARVEEIITTPAEGVTAQEIIDARDGEVSLGAKIGDIDAQIIIKADKTDLGYYWTPPIVPDGTNANPVEINVWTATYAQLIALWESLRTLYPTYITRTALGLDASDTYTIYKYVLSPPAPQKSIIVGASIHGGEKTGAYTLYRLAKELCENWNDEKLSYIRSNVELVILPCQNPWGYENRTRWNATLVNLARNFDYKWSDYVVVDENDVKGASAFSEVESQYIRDVLLDYQEDCVAYIDIHNTGSNLAHARASLPLTGADYFKFIYDNLVVFNNRDIAVPVNSINADNDQPTAFNYAWHVLGLPSSNPEFDDVIWGEGFGTASLTKNLEWNGNIILEHTKLSKINNGIQTYEQTYITGSEANVISNIGAIGGTSYAENAMLQFEVPVGFDGIAIVDYSLVLRGDTSGATTALLPRIYQYGSTYMDENSAANAGQDRWEKYFDSPAANARKAISLQAMLPIQKSGGNFHVGIAHYVSAGTTPIQRYIVRLILMPSNAIPHATSRRRNSSTDTYVRYEI